MSLVWFYVCNSLLVPLTGVGFNLTMYVLCNVCINAGKVCNDAANAYAL